MLRKRMQRLGELRHLYRIKRDFRCRRCVGDDVVNTSDTRFQNVYSQDRFFGRISAGVFSFGSFGGSTVVG